MAAIFPAYIAYGHDESLVFDKTPNGSSAHVVGDLVYWNSTGMDKCGSDPSLIAAVSEVVSQDAKLLTPDGKIPYRFLTPNTVVAMCGTSDPTDQSNVGVVYGVANASSVWQVDLTDTSNTRVLVVAVDTVNKIFFVRFLPANLQFDATLS